jgi:hypothetical protein
MYLGAQIHGSGARVPLMSRKVSRNFDLASEVNSTYPVYSSRLSAHLCAYLIPEYNSMASDVAKKAVIRIFEDLRS